MKFINIHTHQFSNLTNVLEIVNQYPWEFDDAIPQYSVGIHPWYIDQNRFFSDLVFIQDKLNQPQCLALGECGLDKRIKIPFSYQIDVFQKQIELVQALSKPIILHCVASYQEVIAIKKEMKIDNPMIIHGFSKNIPVAKSLLDNGFYLSFGKNLLRNPDLESVFNYVPMDRIFLETDTIKETIFDVYNKAATTKKITIEDLKENIRTNFNKVFKQLNN